MPYYPYTTIASQQTHHPSQSGRLARQDFLRQRAQAAARAAIASKNSQPNQQPAELSENNASLRLTVDLPGVFARDLEVAINHGVLTIQGVRKTMSVDGTVCIKKHKFSRRYAIDTNVVDVARVDANLSHGVLAIRAPKKSGSQHVRIDEADEQTRNTTGNLSSREINVTTSNHELMSNLTPVDTARLAASQVPLAVQQGSEVNALPADPTTIPNGKDSDSSSHGEVSSDSCSQREDGQS